MSNGQAKGLPVARVVKPGRAPAPKGIPVAQVVKPGNGKDAKPQRVRQQSPAEKHPKLHAISTFIDYGLAFPIAVLAALVMEWNDHSGLGLIFWLIVDINMLMIGIVCLSSILFKVLAALSETGRPELNGFDRMNLLNYEGSDDWDEAMVRGQRLRQLKGAK